jgi:two-component system CheB/CheR fusion protein
LVFVLFRTGSRMTGHEATISSAPTSTRCLRILMVEDHRDTANVFGRILNSMGHSVRMAGDCRIARETARQGGFDLLICDIALPDGNGLELLPQLRQELGHFAAIAFSAYASEADQQRARFSGFDAFLAKPATTQDLARVLQRFTNGNGASHS